MAFPKLKDFTHCELRIVIDNSQFNWLNDYYQSDKNPQQNGFN